MAELQNVLIPDIGDATDVEVIEINVAVGDTITIDDTLITLESDKASMDVPSPVAGTIAEIKVAVGDKVAEGSLILTVEAATVNSATKSEKKETEASAEPAVSEKQTVLVPDIGEATDVEVIEINVAVGDSVAVDDTLITLESDKASMDVPSSVAGKITAIMVNVGDKVNAGQAIVNIATEESLAAPNIATPPPSPPTTQPAVSIPTVNMDARDQAVMQANSQPQIYASPAVRRIAQEFAIDLSKVTATGRKGRISKLDVQAYVKQALIQAEQGGGAGGLALTPAPQIDFSKFGEVETQALNKIQRATGRNLHRNWVTIPHVTQFAAADITKMDAFRKSKKAEAEKQGFKLTPIVFIMKAVVTALKEFPRFNASLDVSRENLIVKKYYHLGVAVDTPNGLVVPVIRDVDQKGVFQLAQELGELSVKAREKKLSMQDMQGACFTISSLGGIGGTAFTPIINAPEVAILGLSKAEMKPIYEANEFVPKLMLPLSLSYDHRVIDGADGARFIRYLSECLSDLRTLLL